MKFILIDPSITSVGGHHCEYALHVLQAAGAAGYETHLATNRRYRSGAPEGVRVHPVYRLGFWQAKHSEGFLFRFGAAREKLRVALVCRLRYSALGVAWEFRRRFGDFLHNQPWERRYLRTFPQLMFFAFSIKLLRFLLLVAGLIPSALFWLGRSIGRLGARSHDLSRYCSLLVEELTGLYRYLRRAWVERKDSLEWLEHFRGIGSFQADTRRLFAGLIPGEHDVIFLPTVSEAELLGLAKFLAENADSQKPTWNLLFRGNIYNGRESDYAAQEYSVSHLCSTLHSVRMQLTNHKLALFTDTDELTAQYNRLGGYRFRTVPIPHTHSAVEEQAEQGCLRAVYLGDARSEKGYHLIPGMIQDLWQDFVVPGKVRFILQSNYNVSGGEPAAVVARNQMESLPADRVRLLKEPLASDEYRELLLLGHINLLFYDRRNYYARSSGVLVEALSVGMPVVVPAGTWLSRQFLKETYSHQETWRDDLERCGVTQGGEMKWKSSSSPREGTRLMAAAAVPAGTEFLLASFRFGPGEREMALSIRAFDEAGNPAANASEFLLEEESGRAVCLLRIPASASKLRLLARPTSPNGFLGFAETRLDFLRLPRGQTAPPGGAVGAVYHRPEEITAAMTDILVHFEHYRRTALRLAGPWRAYHNAANLVRILTSSESGEEARGAEGLPALAVAASGGVFGSVVENGAVKREGV
jgi:hypothetical protein